MENSIHNQDTFSVSEDTTPQFSTIQLPRSAALNLDDMDISMREIYQANRRDTFSISKDISHMTSANVAVVAPHSRSNTKTISEKTDITDVSVQNRHLITENNSQM